MSKINFGKILISFVGIIFLLYAAFLFILNFFGEETNAILTSYRQEYGERNETIRNQYTYLFSYEFDVNGKKYSGNGQKIGNSVFLKPDGKSTISIKYLRCCPFLSTANDGSKTLMSCFIFFSIGLLLFYFSGKM